MDHDRRAVPNPTLNQRHDPHVAAAEFEATQVLTLIDIALTFAGLMLVVYLVYLLFYSKKEALRREPFLPHQTSGSYSFLSQE